jgi:hypothetical protein
MNIRESFLTEALLVGALQTPLAKLESAPRDRHHALLLKNVSRIFVLVSLLRVLAL